jgi:hypothetical protein
VAADVAADAAAKMARSSSAVSCFDMLNDLAAVVPSFAAAHFNARSVPLIARRTGTPAHV